MDEATEHEPVPPNAAAARPRRTLARYLLGILLGAGLIYLCVVLLMMWFETLLIFPTWQIPAGNWSPDGFRYYNVEFLSEDGTRLHGWYFPCESPRAFVLYCHGNGEDLGHMGEYMNELREKYRVTIFAFDYRGYGKSEGKPHEAGLVADGRAAQRWLAGRDNIDPDQVVLWGRSIGGAVAVQLAADLGARGLILERTFTSLPDVAAGHYRWLPVRLLMRNRFDSLSRITEYDGPLLQSHGTDDDIVPYELGEQLFAAAASRDKRFVSMPGVTHNAPGTEEFDIEVSRFLERLP